MPIPLVSAPDALASCPNVLVSCPSTLPSPKPLGSLQDHLLCILSSDPFLLTALTLASLSIPFPLRPDGGYITEPLSPVSGANVTLGDATGLLVGCIGKVKLANVGVDPEGAMVDPARVNVEALGAGGSKGFGLL
jgi:hypothetical protein